MNFSPVHAMVLMTVGAGLKFGSRFIVKEGAPHVVEELEPAAVEHVELERGRGVEAALEKEDRLVALHRALRVVGARPR